MGSSGSGTPRRVATCRRFRMRPPNARTRSHAPRRTARSVDALASGELRGVPRRSAAERVAEIHEVQIDDPGLLAEERELLAVGREDAVPALPVTGERDVLAAGHLDRVDVVLAVLPERVHDPCAVWRVGRAIRLAVSARLQRCRRT